ncbi:hypothetical protein HNY73_020661 [Argiope bruennichi]|uniref:Mutator-like transposase domain-containing protein n=1 Tax=Argiope bruennichi TaxID=94029 RepID=A0A8T0EA75_ARGBR|nr:hypothetical protein HNY73_020661 [Argiope bruennichi]
MPRRKQFGKRKLHPNQFSEKKQNVMPTDCELLNASTSKRKLNSGENLILEDGEQRCIGKGKTAASTFCEVMNLPTPPAKFERFYNSLSTALEKVCSKSMMKAVEGAMSLNDNVRDISVALDGTFKKSGHSSMNGVIIATSLDAGKVIDFECLSKYCFTCKNKSNNGEIWELYGKEFPKTHL